MAAACGLVLLLRLNRAARVAGPSVPASAELVTKFIGWVGGCWMLRFTGWSLVATAAG